MAAPNDDALTRLRASCCAVCGTPLMAPHGVHAPHCPRCLLNLANDFLSLGQGALGDRLLDPCQVRTFGDFELREEIARGGMGVVYRAWQISLNREVAIKMILAGELAGRESLRMFLREARAAANLHHPNIVPVYEVGEHELQHYFTMRLIPGRRTIADWAATQRGRWREIAAAAAQVARAVAFAHGHGVLHRDLKPSNILWDDDAGPQVTDFGLAKLLDENDGAVTRTLQAMGSPSYMAPEQMGGRLAEITTSTDVYGLGAVLFEMLSGKPPFAGATAIDTMRRAAEEAPAPLPEVPKDLRTVCLKCLEKTQDHRYASAAELAKDLERFARGEPVSAVPLTPLQTAWRWAQRRPQIAALITLSVGSLVAGVLGIAWQWRTAELARRGESIAHQRTTATVVDLYAHSGINAAKVGDPTRAALWFAKAAGATVDPARRAQELARQMAWRTETHTAVRAFESGIGRVGEIHWNPAQTAVAVTAYRGHQSAIWDLGTEQRWQPDAGRPLERATWAHQASWISCLTGQRIRIIDFPSGHELAHYESASVVGCLAVSPDDRWIAVGATPPFLWDFAAGKTTPLPAGLGAIQGLEFSPDGRFLLLTGTAERGVCALTAPGEFLIPPVPANTMGAVGFLGRGDQFFTTTTNGALWVIETESGRRVETYEISAAPWNVVPAVSPDGRFLGRSTGTLLHRPMGAGTFPIHKNAFEAFDFSRDSQWLVTGSFDATLRLWRLPDGLSDAPIGWHQQGVTAVAMSRDQRRIASAQLDGSLVRIWRLGNPPPCLQIRVQGNSGVRISQDGRLLVPRGWSREADGLTRTRVYTVADAEPVGPELDPGGRIMDAQFAPDGSWLALACLTEPERFEAGVVRNPGAGTLQFWDYRQGRRLGEAIPLAAEPRGLSVHPSGAWVGLYDAQANVREVTVATREIRALDSRDVTHLQPEYRGFAGCAYSPDGTILIGWGLGLSPAICDRARGKRIEPGLPLSTRVMSVDFHRGILATAAMESRIDFLGTPDIKPVAPSLQEADWLFIGRFSPDGNQFLSGGRSSLARIWDWRNSRLQCPALQHDGEVFAAAFIPGTDCVATGALDGQIRFWDRHTGLPLRPPLQQEGKVMELTATPDGRTLIRGSYDSDHLRLYRAADLFPTHALPPVDALLLGEIDAAAETQNGGIEPLDAAAWLKKWQQFRARHPEWHRW